MEVKLIHILNREAGSGHTSQSEAALGHTLDTFNLSPALLFGQRAQTDNTQSNRLTSPMAARVLLLFMAFLPFLTFYCGQSPYATIAWRIPLDHSNVLLLRGQSRPATKHNILCCSASISCALIHLNTASVKFKYGSKHLNSTSVLLNAASLLCLKS